MTSYHLVKPGVALDARRTPDFFTPARGHVHLAYQASIFDGLLYLHEDKRSQVVVLPTSGASLMFLFTPVHVTSVTLTANGDFTMCGDAESCADRGDAKTIPVSADKGTSSAFALKAGTYVASGHSMTGDAKLVVPSDTANHTAVTKTVSAPADSRFTMLSLRAKSDPCIVLALSFKGDPEPRAKELVDA